MKLVLLILVLGALIGAAIYYRDPIQNKISGSNQVASLASPVPDYSTPTPTPVPTATPTPTLPAATAVPSASPLGSIAMLGNSKLPASGPELNLVAVGGVVLAGGTGFRYLRLKRNLKKSWKNIDIK